MEEVQLTSLHTCYPNPQQLQNYMAVTTFRVMCAVMVTHASSHQHHYGLVQLDNTTAQWLNEREEKIPQVFHTVPNTKAFGTVFAIAS